LEGKDRRLVKRKQFITRIAWLVYHSQEMTSGQYFNRIVWWICDTFKERSLEKRWYTKGREKFWLLNFRWEQGIFQRVNLYDFLIWKRTVHKLALAQALPWLISVHGKSDWIHLFPLKGENSCCESLISLAWNKPASRVLHLNFGGKFQINWNFLWIEKTSKSISWYDKPKSYQ